MPKNHCVNRLKKQDNYYERNKSCLHKTLKVYFVPLNARSLFCCMFAHASREGKASAATGISAVSCIVAYYQLRASPILFTDTSPNTNNTSQHFVF
jgi:ADP-ribosylglycohydrolase